MIELNIQEIKEREFQILRHFSLICKTNDIRYCLSNGTLLGAVKYGGFIPWDDDVDVFVHRDDYKRLMECYQDTGEYKLFSLERCEEYCFPFAKLCDMTTVKYEDGYINKVKLGLCIDIFPLDKWRFPYRKAIKQLKFERKLIVNLQYSNGNYGRGRNIITTIVRNVLIFFSKLKGARNICLKMQQIAEKSNGCNESCGCVVWPIYGEREIVPKEVFDATVEVEFEGEKFPAPEGYDVYLRSLYGDYENDPPVERQKTHHQFRAYRIDKEQVYK